MGHFFSKYPCKLETDSCYPPKGQHFQFTFLVSFGEGLSPFAKKREEILGGFRK